VAVLLFLCSSCKAWAHLGGSEACPPGKVWKINTLRMNFVIILPEITIQPIWNPTVAILLSGQLWRNMGAPPSSGYLCHIKGRFNILQHSHVHTKWLILLQKQCYYILCLTHLTGLPLNPVLPTLSLLCSKNDYNHIDVSSLSLNSLSTSTRGHSQHFRSHNHYQPFLLPTLNHQLWNNLPENIVNQPTLYDFKNLLYCYLLQIV